MTLLQRAEDIGLELSARLATRLIAGGAETDLGRVVYRGRRTIDDDMIPCTSIIEGADSVEEGEGRLALDVRVTQQYVFLAYVPCDPANPNDAAHKAIRDMKRAIFYPGGKPDRTLGDRVKRVRYLGRDIGPRGDGAAYVVASIELTVEYVESLVAP